MKLPPGVDWPCHAKPQKDWCDRDGPGGFMGHTCLTIERMRLQRDLDYQASRLRQANEALSAVEAQYGAVSRALGAFDERYGFSS